MLKKCFLSPFFMPLFFILCWGGFAGVIYKYHASDILLFTKEGGFVEDVAHIGYVILIACLIYFCNDYKDKIRSWGIYLFLAMCCFLREFGLHRHLSKTDTTPFKSRFFLNPNNPVGEKIVFGLFLLIILGVVIYLGVKYSKHLVKSFFELNTVTWSIATMCVIGVVSKYIDRFPANYRKANGGVGLSDDVYKIFQLVEETSEMFIPYIAVLILCQYHLKRNEV